MAELAHFMTPFCLSFTAPTHTHRQTHTHTRDGPLQHHNKMKVHYSERKDQARQNGVPPTNFPTLSIKWWRLENHFKLFTYLAGGGSSALDLTDPCLQMRHVNSWFLWEAKWDCWLLTQVELRILWFLGGFNPSENKMSTWMIILGHFRVFHKKHTWNHHRKWYPTTKRIWWHFGALQLATPTTPLACHQTAPNHMPQVQSSQNMEISWNRGTPKSSILIGFSWLFLYKPFWDTPLWLWKPPFFCYTDTLVSAGFSPARRRCDSICPPKPEIWRCPKCHGGYPQMIQMIQN